MTIQRIKPGPRMSGAVVHGNTVYLAGQVANTAAGQSVAQSMMAIAIPLKSRMLETCSVIA